MKDFLNDQMTEITKITAQLRDDKMGFLFDLQKHSVSCD